jgi:hypothetical protein
MLAINGVKVDLNNRENDFVRLVYEPTMKLLKTLDLKRYTFGEVEEKKTITREGIVEHSAGTNPQWNARCSFKTDKGLTVEYFVKYYETSFMDKDGNEQFFAGPNKTRWDFSGTPYQVVAYLCLPRMRIRSLVKGMAESEQGSQAAVSVT